MHEAWKDRLSEYLDGDLDAQEHAACDRHVAGCEECTATLVELRAVIVASAHLDAVPPATDLWPGIAAAIAAAPTGSVPAETVQRGNIVVALDAARTARRRYSFSLPQLAAAAMLLMAFSAGAAWYLAAPRAGVDAGVAGMIVHSAGEVDGGAQLVSTAGVDPAYELTVAELQDALDARRSELDPATVEVLERSIESIDAAIADALAALASDPNNPYLHRQLDSTMRRKIDVLRRAGTLARAGA